MAKLNEQARGAIPVQAPATAKPVTDAGIQQMNLDQVMAAVRRDVEQRKSENVELGSGTDAHGIAMDSTSDAAREKPGAKSEDTQEPPVLSTDEIMQRVRAEVRRRRGEVNMPGPSDPSGAGGAPGSTAGAADQDQPVELPSRAPAIAPLPLKPEYSVHELLQFSDAAFVDTVYRVILCRPADPDGRLDYLSALRNGFASKTEVLGLIRFSEEGRRRGVHINGLLVRYKLQRWRHLPVLGRCLRLGMALVRLPRLSARLQAVETNAARDVQALERFIDLNDAAIRSRFTHVDRLRIALQEQVARMEDTVGAAVARIDAVEERLAMQQQRTDELAGEQRRDHSDFVDRLNGQQSNAEQLHDALRDQQREQRESSNELATRMAAQESALSALGRRLESSRALSEDRINVLMGRLDDQLLTITHLAGDVGVVREQLRAAPDERHATHKELQQRLDEYAQQLQSLTESVRTQEAEYGHHHREVVNHLGAHDTMIKNLSVEGQRAHHGALEIQRQLIALLDRSLSPEPLQSGEQPATHAGDKVLAPQYVAFEDAFRGERDDIKQRVAPYIDTLKAAGLTPDSGLVLDLGCGRGEWLEVLAKNGYTCRGVDFNSAMVADSGASGFDVVEGDAVGYLHDLPDASVAAITAMHIVEHIPHNTLIRLLDHAWRVLIPGGVLILETPNPENLTVGACLFYLDPTHRNPIPPALLQWTVKERGFDDAAIERLTAHCGNPPMTHVPDDVSAAAQINQMIDWFTAAPDYAIVAKKPIDDTEDDGESTTDA